MVRLLRPFTRALTYTRWLHLFMAVVWPSMWWFIFDAPWWWLTAGVLLAFTGLVPAMRTVEGFQARLLLLHEGHDSEDPGIVTAPSVTWRDRVRTSLWLEIRLLLGSVVAFLTIHLPMLTEDLVRTSQGGSPDPATFVQVPGHHWWYMLLAPLPLLVLAALVVASGGLIAVVARRLLGPSPRSNSPLWRSAPSNSWSAPASPVSCTTRSGTP